MPSGTDAESIPPAIPASIMAEATNGIFFGIAVFATFPINVRESVVTPSGSSLRGQKAIFIAASFRIVPGVTSSAATAILIFKGFRA
jgi:hypothetical protein